MMTPKERAAMQQALEALERLPEMCGIEEAITALREALAGPELNLNCKSVQKRLATSWGYVKADQAEQEPVAWMDENGWASICKDELYNIPLYAAPVRTKDLIDDEIRAMFNGYVAPEILLMFRAVIAADRENNK